MSNEIIHIKFKKNTSQPHEDQLIAFAACSFDGSLKHFQSAGNYLSKRVSKTKQAIAEGEELNDLKNTLTSVGFNSIEIKKAIKSYKSNLTKHTP